MNIKKLFLEQNVGGFDLLLRTTLGVTAIIVLASNIVKSSPLKWIVAAIAFSGLYSSIMRHCLPYSILGISTVEDNESNVQESYSYQKYVKRG